MKLLMLQFSSITLQLLLGPMYLPQHTFFPQCGAANFIPSQNGGGGEFCIKTVNAQRAKDIHHYKNIRHE